MKTTYIKDKEEFIPVSITLKCESQEELNAIIGIFNSALIMNQVRKVYNVPFLKPYKELEGLRSTLGVYELHEALRESIE